MTWRTHFAVLATAFAVTACGGSGAGDVINTSGENTAGPNAVEPFVGVWQLTMGWSSTEPDEALLVLRPVDADGRSEVLLYDFTDETDVSSQCYRQPFGNGEAFDAVTDQVFLDFSEFPNGIISSIDETTMAIEFEDAQDINNNGSSNDRLTTTLSRVDQTEGDISPICSNS